MFTRQDHALKRRDAAVHRAGIICDSVADLRIFKADASLGTIAQEMARHTIQRLWEHSYPDRKWINGGLAPINREVPDSALQYTYQEIAKVGRAGFVSPSATSIPTADITGENRTLEIRTPAIAVRYSTQDVRSSGALMFSIVDQKVSSAREGWDLFMDDVIRTGDVTTGVQGVVNHDSIVVQNAVSGDWTNPSTTSDEIIDDVTAAINSISEASDGVEQPNTVVLPIAQFNVLTTRRVGAGLDGGSLTLLQFLRGAFPGIQRWESDFGMATVAIGGGPAMLVYNNDLSKFSAVFPLMMQPLPPQEDGLGFTLIFESRYGGVMMPRPRAFLRLDGI